MELVGLRENCEYNNRLVFSSTLFVKNECQELWSDLCYDNNSPTLSPLKLKDHFTVLVQKAVPLLKRSRYQNIRFDDHRKRYGIEVTKIGINITIYWCGGKYNDMTIKIDLTVGIPLVLTEIQLLRLHQRSVEKLHLNSIHVIPHTRHNGMWRPSFSLSEFKMLKSLTRKQVALYKCLKFCRDINTTSIFNTWDTIPSYYLKIFLFNYIYLDEDGLDAKTIEQQDFISSFHHILHRLTQLAHSPLQDIIPHFFASYNLLLGRYNMGWCKLTLSLLE